MEVGHWRRIAEQWDGMINHYYYLIDTAKDQKKQAMKQLEKDCILHHDQHEEETDGERHMGFCKRCGASMESRKEQL